MDFLHMDSTKYSYQIQSNSNLNMTLHIWPFSRSHQWDYSRLGVDGDMKGLELPCTSSSLDAGFGFSVKPGERKGPRLCGTDVPAQLLNQITQPSSQLRTRTTWMLIERQRGQQKRIRLNKAAASWNLVSLWGLQMKGTLTSLWRLEHETQSKLEALVGVNHLRQCNCMCVFWRRLENVYCHVYDFNVCSRQANWVWRG